MSQVVVDPNEVRRFAQNLKRFNGELQAQMSMLHGQLSTLSQSWRDKEQQKFADEFAQTMQSIGRFIEASEQHVPFLLRKAERIEEYLRQR
ncbi:MAG: WXG100 family type VII secretion target [Planctomycetaceae bacterium]|nr:WXG100 family type VII secretion target [Planctomycetaceae bacterium]